MTMTSGLIASIFRAVSIRVSPFTTLLALDEIDTVSALNRLAASSNERRVRVLGSKKRWTTVLPRSGGTFLMGLSRISLRDSAVSRMKRISSGERVDIPSMCWAARRFMPKKSPLF